MIAAREGEPRYAGLFYGFAAYVIWGFLPIFFKMFHDVDSLQIVAARILSAFLLLLPLVTFMRRWPAIRSAARSRRSMGLLLASSGLIAMNWLIYVFAIRTGHVMQASLGYFINPLVNVALGVLLLGERLRKAQMLAVALAAGGVLVAALARAGNVWLALGLASTFGFYGIIRKVVAVEPIEGLLFETTLLAPIALMIFWWQPIALDAASASGGSLGWLLLLSGSVTAVPLLLFAAAARRMQYSTLGLLQYIAPSTQFLLALFLFGERFSVAHAASFALIWLGLIVYTADVVRNHLREEPAETI